MTNQPPNRRAFLQHLLRGAVIGAGALGLGALVRRSGERCVADGICTACRALPGCGLPQALSAKRAREAGRE